jgi:hypothetical protein
MGERDAVPGARTEVNGRPSSNMEVAAPWEDAGETLHGGEEGSSGGARARPWQGIRDLGHVGARMASMVRGAVTRVPWASRSRGRKMAGEELGADAPTTFTIVEARAGTRAGHGDLLLSARAKERPSRRGNCRGGCVAPWEREEIPCLLSCGRRRSSTGEMAGRKRKGGG